MTDAQAIRPSVLTDEFVVVRVREFVSLRGRKLGRFGQFKGLVPVSHGDALRLVEGGLAKLPGEVSLRQLREHVAALEAA